MRGRIVIAVALCVPGFVFILATLSQKPVGAAETQNDDALGAAAANAAVARTTFAAAAAVKTSISTAYKSVRFAAAAAAGAFAGTKAETCAAGLPVSIARATAAISAE